MARLKLTYPMLQLTPEVTLGIGALRVLADAPSLPKAMIFVSGSPDVTAEVRHALAKRHIDFDRLTTLTKPAGEPTFDMVIRGGETLAENEHELVIGIGGGSVLDWCRLSWLASVGLLTEEGAREPVDRKDSRRPVFWLIPTTCATGAEAASVAVFSHRGAKKPVVSPAFLPDRVVLDGRFLQSLPVGGLENALSDALSHCVEAYVSPVPNSLAKDMAASSLQTILEEYEAPSGPARHQRLMEAAYLAGLAAAHCSVGVVHAFAHSVARFGLGHGHANSLGLVPGIRANAYAPGLAKLLVRLGLADVDDLVRRLHPIVSRASQSGDHQWLLPRLRTSRGRTEIREQMMSDVCFRTNPVPLSDGDLELLLLRVLETAELADDDAA